MNDLCFFVSDLHGKVSKYEKLLLQIAAVSPRAVFFGGDLLPGTAIFGAGKTDPYPDFVNDYLGKQMALLREKMGASFPLVFIIPGNDDPRMEEASFLKHEKAGLWHYIHNKAFNLDGFTVYGYANVPPTPFMLKDWERYDVSRFVDPGCVHPTEGFRTVKPEEDVEFATIREDLNKLAGDKNLDRSVFLFHSPPYQTYLDRAALDGVMIDHVPADVHVGSIAIKEFIEQRQPLLTLHGHIHESASITGYWKQQMGNTWALSAAGNAQGLSLVRFNLRDPGNAERCIL